MKGKKIGIIGLGWVGIPLAEKIESMGGEVIGTSTSIKKDPRLQKVHQYEFKLSENSPLPDAFKLCDHIVITIPPSADQFEKGLISILESIKDIHVTFLSSTGVYGSNAGKFDEKSPLEPDRESTKKIVSIENKIAALFPTNSSIFRLAGLIGPGRNPAKFFQKKGVIPSPNLNINIVHLSDVIASIIFILQQNSIPKIINVVSPFHPQKGEFYTQMAKIYDYPIPLKGEGKEERRIILSSCLDELGYDFKIKDFYSKELYQ